MGKTHIVGLIFAGALLAFGIGISGYFISQTLYNSKVAINIAEAKGLAERQVTSDRANWTVYYSVEGDQTAEMADLYGRFEADQKIIVDELHNAGFNPKEVSIGAARYSVNEFRNDAQIVVDATYTLSGRVTIDTTNVLLVASAQVSLSKLLAKGIGLEVGTPSYQYTKLNDIKPQMLKEATKNARIAATTFAENVGARVGGIKSAAQGRFNIRDAGEEYGDRGKIEKDIRVVTTVSFYIEN